MRQACILFLHLCIICKFYPQQLFWPFSGLSFICPYVCQSNAFLQTAQKDSVSPPETELPSFQVTWFLGSRTWSHHLSCTSNSCLVHYHKRYDFQICLCSTQNHIQVMSMCFWVLCLCHHTGVLSCTLTSLRKHITRTSHSYHVASVTVPRHREYFYHYNACSGPLPPIM